jgi:3-hydroxyacyl-[acyl-carrier-protein] dehydratase
MHLSARISPDASGEIRAAARALRRDSTVTARMNVKFGPMSMDCPFDYRRLRRSLPYAHPMLLVDRIVAVEPGVSITALKAVTLSEPCHRDLAPDAPRESYAYPPSLLLESFGQAAAALWLETAAVRRRTEEEIVILASAHNCGFEGDAFPGDVLRHVARLDRVIADAAMCPARRGWGTVSRRSNR